MLNKALEFVARVALGKKLLGAVAWGHDALDGHRSEVILGIVAVIHVLKVLGLVPADTAESVEKSLLALLPLTLADKASKVMKSADNVLPSPPEKKG